MEYQKMSSRMRMIVSLVNLLSSLGVTMMLPATDTLKRRIVLEDDPEGDFRAVPPWVNEGGVLRSGMMGDDVYAILALSPEEDLKYRAMWGLEPREEDV